MRDSCQVPTAVATYRKALAASQNHSVAIASIGITTNMRDLVLSERDEFSPLSGPELIGQKVKLIVWMDGGYNFVRACLAPPLPCPLTASGCRLCLMRGGGCRAARGEAPAGRRPDPGHTTRLRSASKMPKKSNKKP